MSQTQIKVIAIGDIHVQTNNICEIDLFIERIEKLVTSVEPDIIVILGDVLHYHERLHTTALNKACEFINKMREICLTYVLVGNHDMINNGVFLSDEHWMNPLKEWDNVIIVDKVVVSSIEEHKFVFSPYVPPGRFEEALNTVEWNDASCIFAHQEIFGCKMGAITSVVGDKWDHKYPYLVSGHIHSKQTPYPNVYYPGSCLQHAFGESEKNIIPVLSFNEPRDKYVLEEVDLKLPRKKTLYMKVDEIDSHSFSESDDKVRITLSGGYDDFKALKKTTKYKEIIDKGVKVVFKPDNKEIKYEEEGNYTSDSDFHDILRGVVLKQNDRYLQCMYELIVNCNIVEPKDIIFYEY
jgi:DNA repair exonuclease SbcCD nuclease subunit